jgi:FAD/FMN-containing dehydrogenase/Fe-S oxidoreductase
VRPPAPLLRRPPLPHVDTDGLYRALLSTVDGEVRFDDGSRATYATDGSNYRQVPVGVVVPRSVEAGVRALAVCREFGAPVLSRGGGTSLAGQCCNTAVVVDWSKYCHRVEALDPDRRTAIVEPGIVLDDLNRVTRRHGLVFGPKPATHDHCTVGGMIGNNSCGATAQMYGKTVDNVLRLEVATYDGTRFWAGRTSDDEYARILAEGGPRARIYRELRELRDRYADLIRARFPDIPRRVSGYNLDSLLPERGFDVAGALVGSESTLVTVLRAELALVPDPRCRAMVVLGYPDIYRAADAVPAVTRHGPLVLEGVDDRLVAFEKRKHLHPEAVRMLPEGAGWLVVQFAGDSQEEADARARSLVDELERGDHPPAVRFFDDPAREDELWQVRESGLGATAQVPGMPDTWEGWEDSAVPPDRLGEYLRDLHALMGEFGYGAASLYGHFGQGCVHTRIPFDLVTAEGVRRFRGFVERAADLVVHYGGSFSGEHGDGQSRAELWPRLFGDDLVRAFGEFKAIFDPADRMNPGRLSAPYRLDENLRLGPDYQPWAPATEFGYPHDDGSFGKAVLRCVGVGKCRHDRGGVMCPSYRATREEEHSTRGRARVLFEMLHGEVLDGGWRSPAVLRALDLCLACKGCRSDCPVNVDMATYKAEFLAHHYAGRLRPAAHYSMGWLPVWARLAALAPRLVNTLTRTPGVARALKRAGGVAPERPVPAFARERFVDWYRRRGPRGDGRRGEVLLWPDTFSNNLHPSVARAAVEVLEAAGFSVRVPDRTVCCGLTWISTGQLRTAKRVAGHALRVLREPLHRGVPVVGLEPSCTAVFRSDLPELLPHDHDAHRMRAQTFTLAELLTERASDWSPPRVDTGAVVQPHCHQHAVLGMDAERELMRRAGMDAQVLDVGCCGLAGNFGFERGHFAVSMRCAELGLLPAVRDADPRAYVLADGFSCRMQIEHAGCGREAVHLAEALAAALDGRRPGEFPERVAATRPAPPRQARWSGDLSEQAVRDGTPRSAGTWEAERS